MEELIDQPLRTTVKKPIWAIISLLTGLAGFIATFYFAYYSLASMRNRSLAGDGSLYDIQGMILFAGVSLLVLYLISLGALIASFVKESFSAIRVIAIMGHAFCLVSFLFALFD